MTGRGRPRSTLLVGLLALALVLTAVLAYQAATAERSQRKAAERALHDYASFAMWQLNQQATQELLSSMITTFIVPLTRVNENTPETWPSPADFMAASRMPYVPAPYLDGVRFYFRFDWRDSAMTIAGQEPSATVPTMGARHSRELSTTIRGTRGAHAGVRVCRAKSRQAAGNCDHQRFVRRKRRQHRRPIEDCVLRRFPRH